MMASQAPERPSAVPSKLRRGMVIGGKYALRRCMAVGGMGEIWVAKNQMTRAEVALKVLRPDVDVQLEAVPRFHQEARLGAMLSHRNIVRVFDLMQEGDGALVLVMELLHGETLADRLAEKKTLETSEAIAIALPILSALDHAHENGVVHRDLKPENIYLAVDPDGHVVPKLLDFGIAKIPEHGTKTLDGRVLGTPQYMSPEQIRAEPKIDGRSDIFGMAVLVLKMLTGASPFFSSTPSAALAAVLETEVDPDPSVDPRIWLVLKRALAKRAYERHARASEFADALRQAAGFSDSELANALKRDRPAQSRRQSIPGGSSAPGAVPPAPTSSASDLAAEAALEVRSGSRSTLGSDPDGLPRSPGRMFLVAGAAAACVLAIGVAVLLGGRKDPPPAPNGPQVEATASAAASAAPSSAIEIPPVAETTSASAPTQATPSSTPPARRTPPTRTAPLHKGGDTHKQVATTPGF